METRTIAVLLVSIVAGMTLAVPITPVFSLLRKIFYVPFIRRRLLREATERGHVVQARLEKQRDEYLEHKRLGRIPSPYQEGIYYYEYGGRCYRYRYHTAGIMPEELTLYFQRFPKRACLSSELGIMESNWWIHYFVLACIASVAVFCVLTMKGWLF